MAEIVAKVDPEFLAEVRRIRELLEERKGSITQTELVEVLLDALSKNVGGIRDAISHTTHHWQPGVMGESQSS